MRQLGTRQDRTPPSPGVASLTGHRGAGAVSSCHASHVEELEDGWHGGGRVVWKKLEWEGEHYVIAGAPRGVFLWSEGNIGIDVASVVLSWIWSTLAGLTVRTSVVKVRRRKRGGLYVHMLRREFPASMNLLECVKSVEREVRDGTAGSA